MRSTKYFTNYFLALSLLTYSLAADASPQLQTPDGPIRSLYQLYGIGSNSGKTGLDLDSARQLFDPALFKLYQAAYRGGALDFDFFVQGQDFDLKKPVEVTKTAAAGATARVWATLTQNGLGNGKPGERQDNFVFSLIRGKSGWQVDDVLCKGSSFREELAAEIKEAK